MGVENGIFWSEIGSGFGELGHPPPPLPVMNETAMLVRNLFPRVKKLE